MNKKIDSNPCTQKGYSVSVGESKSRAETGLYLQFTTIVKNALKSELTPKEISDLFFQILDNEQARISKKQAEKRGELDLTKIQGVQENARITTTEKVARK